MDSIEEREFVPEIDSVEEIHSIFLNDFLLDYVFTVREE